MLAVARHLEINAIIHGRWVNKHQLSVDGRAFRDKSKLSPEQAEIKKLKQQVKYQTNNLYIYLPESQVEISCTQLKPHKCHLVKFDISMIKLNPKSRDDIPAILAGLQHIYTTPELHKFEEPKL